MSINGVIISAIASAILFAALQIVARQRARFDQQSGATILEHHLMMKLFAVLVAFVLPPSILLFSIYSPIFSKHSPWFVITIASLILAIGMPLYIETTCLRIFISPE